MDLRMRERVIVQTADVQNRNSQIDRRLDIRRIERPGFRGMLVHAHRHVKRFLDVRDCAFHIDDHAVRMRAAHRQPIGLRKSNERLVIFFRRTKHLRELFRRQIVTVPGTGRVVDLLEQVVERFPVAQRQPNRQPQTCLTWQAAGGQQARHRCRYVTVQDLRCCRPHPHTANGPDEEEQPPPNLTLLSRH